MTEENWEVRLSRRPVGRVEVDDLVVTRSRVPRPAAGEVLVRNTWLSVDPALRMRLDECTPRGYLPPVPVGGVLGGLAIGEVVESRAPGFTPGDTVQHVHGYRQYAAVPFEGETFAGAGALTKVDVGVAPARHYLGPLGSAGLTAYAALVRIAELRDSDVVWVSAAAGAVGGLAVQLARLRGNRVIGTAGSPEKAAHVRDVLGAEAAFDYHGVDLVAVLADLAPDGVDVYVDNVGGTHLEAALSVLRPHGRVALVGAIAAYDGNQPPGPTNLFEAVARSLTLRGFRAGDHADLMDAMRAELGGHIAHGRLRVDETIYRGIESAPQAIVGMLRGSTLGKTLVEL